MKKIYYSIILTVISLGSFSLKWTYNTGKSDFDGTYKTASIYGSGGEFPYTKPLFVINYFINGGINLYLTGAGYAGCDNKEAYLKFDKDEKTYKFNVTTNSNKDTWFIGYYKGNELDFSTIDLLSKLKNHSRLSVRLLSDCGQIDYLFSLNGSTPAINFVSKEYVEWVNKEIEIKKSLESEVLAKTRELAEKNILLEQYSNNLENATVQIMSSLQAAMEEKDGYTAGHTRRVTEYVVLLGEAAGIQNEDMVVLRRASQFHDIGKLVIDLSCIQKPGVLTPEEWVLIKKHPEVGASIIEPLTFMDRERDIIRHHHEKLDGSGYPDGLRGNELDTLTRIITIADSYDAMTSRRNYRKNLTTPEAVGELRRCAGSQFDLELVELFAGVVLSVRSLYKQ